MAKKAEKWGKTACVVWEKELPYLPIDCYGWQEVISNHKISGSKDRAGILG